MNINNLKLNVLLGKTDALAPSFKGHLKDYTEFFKKSQGAFLGEKNTYTANPGTVDEAGKRSVKRVQTTVDEKLGYFVGHQSEYLDCLFSQEATNASGTVKAQLMIDGRSWGEFSSLEILRLKSVLEMQEFKLMHESIVVRSDAKVWEPCTDMDYEGRSIVQTPLQSWAHKTTEKDAYILEDPNVKNLRDPSGYKPVTASHDIVKELGQATHQEFSGEWTQKEKADILDRIHTLKVACTVALKECNEAQVVASGLTGEKLFNYLYDI